MRGGGKYAASKILIMGAVWLDIKKRLRQRSWVFNLFVGDASRDSGRHVSNRELTSVALRCSYRTRETSATVAATPTYTRPVLFTKIA